MNILLWIVLVIGVVNFCLLVSVSSFLYRLAEHIDFDEEEEAPQAQAQAQDDSGLMDIASVGNYDPRYRQP